MHRVALVIGVVSLVALAPALAAGAPSAHTDRPLQDAWLKDLAGGHSAMVAQGIAAVRIHSEITREIRATGAVATEIRIYQASGSLAPDVEIRSVDTASFIRHRLARVLATLHSHPYAYLRVSDVRGVALDWYQRPGGGALYLRPDVAGCSPIHSFGPTPHPCPAP